MASLQNSSCHINLLLLYLLLVIITSSLISSTQSQNQPKISDLSSKKRIPMDIIDDNNDEPIIIKKENPKTSLKNQTKLIKPSSSKNQTKLTIPQKNDSSSLTPKSHFEKKQPKKPQKQVSFINEDDDEEDDLVSEFKTLTSKFQESFVPDMQRISKTSKKYLTNYNKEITKGFKPYIGNKYAQTIAQIVSFTFIIIPLIFVTFFLSKIQAYFSLQKLLIIIQVYLAIYFFVLALSSLATGLEPLKFLYSTSQRTYICVQIFQTIGYMLYLLLLLMYLILVFSSGMGLGTKLLGLGQTFVGFSVGLHYYMTVFHRAVLHHPPKTSWKAHGLYATCFGVICLLGTVDGRRKKKAYLEEGAGEEGKKD